MERGGSEVKVSELPPGYINQHTLWTRRTFNQRADSKEWRSMRGMVMLMPKREEEELHKQFFLLYPQPGRFGGLPLPSQELTRVAMGHLHGIDPIKGRKQQFESLTKYMRELANTATIRTQADEARLFAGHFALQLDFYGNALTADQERELELWTPAA